MQKKHSSPSFAIYTKILRQNLALSLFLLLLSIFRTDSKKHTCIHAHTNTEFLCAYSKCSLKMLYKHF